MSENRIRISRRMRRTIVPESDDEEQVLVGKGEEHDQREGRLTPAPRKSLPKAITSRRKSKNKIAELSQNRDHIDESSLEENDKIPEHVDQTDHSTAELVSPLRKASLCEQKIETCQNTHENVSINMSILPLTPKPSPSPELVPQNVTAFSEFLDPLNGQITSTENPNSKGDPIKSEDLPEKPIDIVLKSRTMVIPIKEDTSPKPRIVITYLILTNFKSYAGRQEVGPFHTSFSSVVGPNGSGKSNVIDSLLFVFGFRASKMRQGKISALIHNSSQFPNLDHCEVTVHFQEVIDQPNGMPVILSNSDLIISRLCAEKNGRVQHVEKEKNNLEDKKNKALAYVRDENELVMKQSALYQIYVEECSNNLLVTEEAISQLQALLDTELEKHQGSEAEIKKLNKLHENGQTRYKKLEVIAQSVVREMAKFDQEHIKFEEKKKFLVDKQKKAQKNIDDSMATSTEAQLTIENCTSEIETSFKNITEMEKQLNIEKEELNSIRESLKGKTQIFSDQIAEKQKSLEPWNEKISQNQSAVAISESELMILHEKANAGAVALEETKARISCIQEDCEAKKLNLEACRSERDKLKHDAREVQLELDQLAIKVPELRSKLSVARQKADEARASLKNTQTQGNVLTGLMRLKESGRIDGFHGRLGNLGTIDKQYDVAISTACSALNNFVTETVEGAQQCIEYLRKTNLGRGNFLCLDKIGVKDMSPIQTPENVPRLFDLIKARDEKFRSAFYHSLQNTLVAQDLAQANRIAYGARRWRVVTLDGQLIDKSGTMSGGGNTARKGLMSYKLTADITKEQVVKLEFDRDSLEHDYQKYQDRQKDLEVNLRDINEKIPLLDTKMQKIGLELESSAKNLVDAQRRTLEISKEHQPSTADSARVKSLEKVITDLKVELLKLREGSVSLEDEIRQLQEKIMQVGGEKLRAQKVKVDVLKESIDSLGEKISSAEVIRAKAEKQKIKHEKTHAKAIKDFESASVDLQELEEEIQNQSDNAQNYQARVDEAQAELKEKKKELQSLKSEIVEKTSILNEIRVIEIEMRNKLEENQKVLTENRNRLKYWTEKLGKLKLQNIDDLGENEVNESQALPEYTKDELVDMSKDALKSEIAALEEKTQNTNVDLSVLAEYRRRVEEHAMRNADLQDAISQRDTSKKRCDDLRQLRLQGFMEGFSTISLRLKEMYQMITMGGNAELELVDSLDPFSEGILFSVMPPKKSWKNISNLSGGEKTLSSLALVFALHHYKPTPLYVMDEIDAALDFRNVSIVANYIKERTKNAQFIVISLRNNMFELATRLVGVYKVNNMTKSVTIENRDYINAYALKEEK
ncbi:hypothetical protein Golomagni_02433 [Golovinomyces magnicellulatus]|nr:hypothetical protein Golomagni_02433 [Golovinomyces magnicellulatus]